MNLIQVRMRKRSLPQIPIPIQDAGESPAITGRFFDRWMSDEASEHVPGQLVDAEAQLYRKVTWRLIPLLFACYVAAYLDRVNVGFAKSQMLGDLHFSDTVYGLEAGIFFIGYFLFEVPSNIILHVRKRRGCR